MPIKDIAQVLLYITPGFLTLALYHKKYPARKDSDFFLIAWSLVYGVIISTAVYWLDNSFFHHWLHSTPLQSLSDEKHQISINFRFITALYVGGLLLALIKIAWRTLAYWLSARYAIFRMLAPDDMTIWAKVNKDPKPDWAVVFLDDGAIYIGQIKHWAFIPDNDDHDFLLSKARRVEDDLSVKYEVPGKGVYLNTRNVRRIEFLQREETSVQSHSPIAIEKSEGDRMQNQNNSSVQKHLEFIQLTIVRMAANSFIIKGWTVTLVAAILAFTTAEQGSKCGWISLIPAFIFWGLDGYYLRQERLFRKLYDHVRKNSYEGTDFSMDTKPGQYEVSGWLRVCCSKTIFWFYLPLAVVAALIARFVA